MKHDEAVPRIEKIRSLSTFPALVAYLREQLVARSYGALQGAGLHGRDPSGDRRVFPHGGPSGASPAHVRGHHRHRRHLCRDGRVDGRRPPRRQHEPGEPRLPVRQCGAPGGERSRQYRRSGGRPGKTRLHEGQPALFRAKRLLNVQRSQLGQPVDLAVQHSFRDGRQLFPRPANASGELLGLRDGPNRRSSRPKRSSTRSPGSRPSSGRSSTISSFRCSTLSPGRSWESSSPRSRLRESGSRWRPRRRSRVFWSRWRPWHPSSPIPARLRASSAACLQPMPGTWHQPFSMWRSPSAKRWLPRPPMGADHASKAWRQVCSRFSTSAGSSWGRWSFLTSSSMPQ